jgi:hypothetical protein
MHASGGAALGAYLVEAERTAAMLAECTAESLSFTERGHREQMSTALSRCRTEMKFNGIHYLVVGTAANTTE